MRKKRLSKRLLALFLSAGILLTSAPVSAEELKDDNQSEIIGLENEVKQEYTLQGKIVLSEPENTETLLKDIQIKVYDKSTFKSESTNNEPAFETISDEYGGYELKNIPEGNYRIEFLALDPDFNMSEIEVVIPEDENYDLQIPKEEESYFAYIDDYSVCENSTLDITCKRIVTTDATEKDDSEESKDTIAEENNAGASDNPEEKDTQGDINFESAESKKTDGAESNKSSSEQKSEQQTKENNQTEENKENSLSVEALKTMEADQVFATVVLNSYNFKSSEDKDWSFDAYYVNQPDDYHVEKTEDFNLKYQMEFHNSRDLNAGDVEIRIERKLLDDREGKAVYPSDLAVPKGTPENYTESKVTPFNYYIDGDEIVFFNYKKITSGSNVAFQVLYKNLELMDLVDGTTWTLNPSITVNIDGKVESEKTKELTGLIDSSVNLSSVSKSAFDNPDVQYTPGLYTKDQVRAYLNHEPLPEKYEKNFNDYRYVVWEISVIGNANQAWSLYLKDTPSIEGGSNGEIVGIARSKPSFSDFKAEYISTGEYSGYYKVEENVKQEDIRYTYRVVTAYPQGAITSDHTVVKNTADVILVPYDGLDDDQTSSASAKWTYVDYSWFYQGDTIGIGKSAIDRNTIGSVPEEEVVSKGWLDVYKEARNRKEDKGDFFFRTYTITNGYGFAHYTEGDKLGQLKPGMSYTMASVDDFVYAYDSSGNYRILDSSDYYFSEINIRQWDTGYDPWEDRTDTPETSGGTSVYAMYAGSNTWELVTTIPWSESGNMTYSFTQEQLARQPWRVKAEHNTTNYRTECTIEVNVKLRYDSPRIGELLNNNPSYIKIENISGVMGWTMDNGVKGEYFQNQEDDDGNYSEPELWERTNALYGCILMRNNAYFQGTTLTPHAESHKTAETWNDPDTGRVNLTYNLTAFDGYEVYGEDAVSYLESSGKESPGRNEVVFYDLLPYGVKFDPSVQPTAGRITELDLKDRYRSNPDLWDSSQVRVVIDSQEDVIPDYKGTGRTMLRFHLYYDGSDPTVYTNKMWMEGWGVSFGAYYEWKDAGVVGNGVNISAFMPAKDDNRALIGTDDEVALDNGTVVPSGLTSDCQYFGSDIDGDGNTNEKTVLYARADASDDVALSGSSQIQKLVKADDDRFGVFSESAVVNTGAGYTYDVTVSNASKELKDIVIFDVLEDARNRRGDQEEDMQFENDSWYGTFKSVDTRPLEILGIDPVVYYNADRNVQLPTGETDPASVLTEQNGWYTKERWETLGKKTEDVKAVAVDISKNESGGDYVLGEMQSVGFQINMTAPSSFQSAKYAYNNSAFYSYDVETGTKQTVIGNSVKVSLNKHESLEIVKKIVGELPEAMEGAEFGFTVTRSDDDKKIAFASQEYELWRKDEQGQYQKVEGQIFATDAEGRLYLHDGEKAVFPEVPDTSLLEVKEDENPFWKVSEDIQTEGTNTVITFENEYRPVLYLYKNTLYGPDKVDDSFVYQILADGKPLANSEFWYVDRIRTDGGIPSKVTSKGNNGVGTTDKNGNITIKQGEIIAVFPGKVGTKYEVTEVEGYGEGTDWICTEPSKTGTIPVNGTSDSITNIYKWKDLYLTKTLTHQDPEECTQSFTFEIRDNEGMPIKGNKWILMEGDKEVTSGTIVNGKLTCKAAGRIIIIKNLEAGKSYTVQETFSGEYYEPQNGGIAEVTMPIYASKQEAEIINDYLLRPLSVTKQVSYDQDDTETAETLKTKFFTMYIKRNGIALTNFPYTVTKEGKTVRTGKTDYSGKFTLKHGETATFEDVGVKGTKFEVREVQDKDFPQIYPSNRDPITGELGREGSSVTFVNGTAGNLLIQKEYTADDEGAGAAYVESLKNDPQLRAEAAVSMKLKVTEGGSSYIWPKSDETVNVIDQIDGNTEQRVWKAGSEFTVEPWETVEIPDISPGAEYSLSESSEDQHRIYQMEDGTWVEISQTEPQNDRPVTGTPAENPLAIIYNGVKELKFNGSEIHKKMAPGSNEVPVGAKLVWRLEQYDGTVWNPAEGVSYLIADESGPACDRTLVTESDGLIELQKTENGYPSVRFLDKVVRVNLYSGMAVGDYRLVEVKELSDPQWGDLVGYENADGDYSLDIDSDSAIGFVNSNRTTPVEIEKQMTEESSVTDAKFTMILKQVISGTSPITTADQIKESIPGAGIEYVICDSESGEQIGTGRTTSSGEIKLAAGEFARLQLPDQTLWTVEEKIQKPYVLKSLTGQPPEKITKLGNNLVLLNQQAEVIPVGIQAEAAVKAFLTGTTITKDNFSVSLVKSDGSTEKITTDQFEISPNKAPDEQGMFNVTVTAQGFSTTVQLEAIGTIPLTKEMVDKGVTDALTNEHVSLTGDVVIPKQIIWEEKQYVINAIGEDAFANNTNITSVVMPDSIISIGANAFRSCTNMKGTVDIPDAVTEIGSGAFYFCGGISGEMVIPEGVTSIGANTFYKCTGLEGIVLPRNLTNIGARAFFGCTNLSSELNLPATVTSIGEKAFSGCSKLHGEINLTQNLAELGAFAFENCSGLTGNVVISDHITSIGEATFKNCTGLTGTLTLPNGLSTIGKDAFFGCGFTGQLLIPGNVVNVEETAFYDCKGFTSLTIQGGAEERVIGYLAFGGMDNLTGNLVIPEGVTEVGQSAFLFLKFTTISIPSTLKADKIGSRAFAMYDRGMVISVKINQKANSFTKQQLRDTGILHAIGDKLDRIQWLG